jgi:hypothetical protein
LVTAGFLDGFTAGLAAVGFFVGAGDAGFSDVGFSPEAELIPLCWEEAAPDDTASALSAGVEESAALPEDFSDEECAVAPLFAAASPQAVIVSESVRASRIAISRFFIEKLLFSVLKVFLNKQTKRGQKMFPQILISCFLFRLRR